MRTLILLNLSVIIVAAFAVGLLVWLSGSEGSGLWILPFMTLIGVTIVITGVVALRAVDLAFRLGRDRLRAIVCSYMSIIITFGSLYLVWQVSAEHEEAIEVVHREVRGRKWVADPRLPIIRSEKIIWIDDGSSPENVPMRLTIRSFEAFLELALDCYGFSFGQAGATSRGDLSPGVWYVKLAALFQNCLGLSILILAVGRFFSRGRNVGT